MMCSLAIPLYQQVVRQYDANECIVSRKVYLVSYGGHLYGTLQFTNMSDFVNYVNASCVEDQDDCCYLTHGGCYVTFGGSRITI